MRYEAEPAFPHGTPERTGVLLINLGTPTAPQPAAVRHYLREFLADPRVVEIPRVLWAVILHGIILNTRPQRSAKRYAMIWRQDGSPLAVYTARQSTLLRGFLGERAGPGIVVEHAMRYGEPAVDAALRKLRAQRCTRVLVVPLYPQYAASTSASAMDAVFRFMARTRNVPEIRFVKHFHDDPGYINALVGRVRTHWEAHGRPDKLVISFHGLPRYTLERGDPYHCECLKTARLLSERLGLAEEAWTVSFQSRFGRARWLEPYTADVLDALGRAGTRRVDVIAPGFVADCLETLEELGMEGRATFLGAGGKEFFTIPCLNDDPSWIEALAGIVVRSMQGWAPAADGAALAERTARARARGAAQ